MAFGLDTVVGIGAQVGGAWLQNQWNRSAAERAQGFSERMSSTAHQREVADLKAAGLNPMLSVNAGASSPTGFQAPVNNPLEGVGASARDITRMRQEVKESNSRIDAQSAAAEASRALAERERTQSRLNDADFFQKAKYNEFLTEHPEFIAASKIMELISSGMGTARDAAIGFRSLKGFGDYNR